MNKLKLQETNGMSPHQGRLEHWTSRELQLSVLHGEIIHKREALLGMSRNWLQGKVGDERQLKDEGAKIRNDRLMKDIEALEDYVTSQQQEPVNPRFAHLQANYKSLVENMFPIWQKSLQELQAGGGNTRKDG